MPTIVLGLVVLTIAGVFSNQLEDKHPKIQEVSLAMESPTPTMTPTPTPTIAPTIAPTVAPTVAPTKSPENEVHINNGNQNVSININNNSSSDNSSAKATDINEFKYPNSTKSGDEGNDQLFQSSDNPDTITNWYKDKIRNLGFNSKSFVTTKSNGNILNKLVASGNGQQIKVEITGSDDQNLVKIRVTLALAY